MRSYDIEALIKSDYYVIPIKDPVAGNDLDFIEKFNVMEKWADANLKGDYLFLLSSVVVTNTTDELIFTLKYG